MELIGVIDPDLLTEADDRGDAPKQENKKRRREKTAPSPKNSPAVCVLGIKRAEKIRKRRVFAAQTPETQLIQPARAVVSNQRFPINKKKILFYCRLQSVK